MNKKSETTGFCFLLMLAENEVKEEIYGQKKHEGEEINLGDHEG